jgi:hypothetical protein
MSPTGSRYFLGMGSFPGQERYVIGGLHPACIPVLSLSLSVLMIFALIQTSTLRSIPCLIAWQAFSAFFALLFRTFTCVDLLTYFSSPSPKLTSVAPLASLFLSKSTQNWFEEEEVPIIEIASSWLDSLFSREMNLQDVSRLWGMYVPSLSSLMG